MTRLKMWVTTAWCLVLVIAGCSEGIYQVSTPDLIKVIERDGIPFDGPGLPEGVVDRLAQYKVVVLGEMPRLREHQELLAELIRVLYAREFRQLLVHWPQMSDWVIDDYVKSGGLEPEWQPPAALGEDLLGAIREFNETLPLGAQFDVHAIDVNLDDYCGAAAFLDMLSQFTSHLAPHEVLTRFISREYSSPKSQRAAVESLRGDLQSHHNELIELWGQRSFNLVSGMIEVELVSIGVRALRADYRYASADLRENAMNRIATLNLADNAYHTLINIDNKHARKKHSENQDPEWLGEYLSKNSAAVGGSVFIVKVVAAEIRRPDGVENLLAGADDNDVLRVMKEAWPGQSVFLPLDDAIFRKENVPMVTEGFTYPNHLKEYFDAIILLPTANQVPLK